MNQYKHLSLETIPMLERSAEERLHWFQTERWFEHDAGTEIMETLGNLVKKPRKPRMAGVLITQDSNGGKSSLARRFLEQYPVVFDDKKNSTRIDVLYMEMPHNPNDMAIIDELLSLLDLPFKPKDNIQQKRRLLINSLRAAGIRLLIVDEFQRLLGVRKDAQRLALDLLRLISNSVPLPLSVLSTPRGAGVLSASDEMINRLRPIQLPLWLPDKTFQNLLKSFEEYLPLPKASHLASPEMAALIHEYSEGLIGEVVDLLDLALAKALKDKLSCISGDLLRSLNWVRPSDRKMRVSKQLS